MAIRVTVWNEFIHERQDPQVQAIYPRGIHETLADCLRPQPDMVVATATLDQPEHGLTQEVLNNTDVLLWWGHCAHGAVSDAVVERVYDRVLDGMGLIVLHSGHASKIFQKLCGTRSNLLSWREDGGLERLFIVSPGHPIAAGLPEYFEIPHDEMYGEYFNIPAPDELIFISWFAGGEVFRSGFTYTRGKGRVFYFQPGHETHPVYGQPEVRQVIINAVRWAAPAQDTPAITYRANIPLPRR